MEDEYGNVGKIRFIPAENIKMVDADGHEVLCKCGKPAGSGMIGENSYICFCNDCSPVGNSSANFIYRCKDES